MILPMPALPQSGNHFIVCGDGPLAYRITEELTSRYREQVTVIRPSRRRGSGPRISTLPGVRVLERRELTDQAFTDAGITSARAVALLWQEDIVNFHAALRAQDLNPAIRLVVAVFNTRLAEHFGAFFTDCTVLSGTEMAAPAFVAAALGGPLPATLRSLAALCMSPGVRMSRRSMWSAGSSRFPATQRARLGCCRPGCAISSQMPTRT